MLRITTEWSGTLGGTPYFNQMYWGGSDDAAADAAAAALTTFWGSVDGLVTSLLTWNIPSEAEFVDETTGQVTGISQITAASGSGTQPGDTLPPNTQGLLRWRTGVFVSGREIRGRTFVPGPPEGLNSTGIPVASYRNDLQSYATTLLVGSTSAGGFVIYSPTHNQSANVTTASVWTKWATLRSRRD